MTIRGQELHFKPRMTRMGSQQELRGEVQISLRVARVPPSRRFSRVAVAASLAVLTATLLQIKYEYHSGTEDR